MPRANIPTSTQAEVLTSCRRRCCVCFGLNRDETLKKGQIAHLDGDPSNNDMGNLAYLCFDHHDELDSKSSQAKGLTPTEVRRYREELFEHYSNWSSTANRQHLLNFLAAQITLTDIALAVVKVASTVYFYGPRHAHDVLTWPELRTPDYEEALGHLVVLDACQSWGLLTYGEEETVSPEGGPTVLITVHHKPVCEQIASILEGMITKKGETNWTEHP